MSSNVNPDHNGKKWRAGNRCRNSRNRAQIIRGKYSATHRGESPQVECQQTLDDICRKMEIFTDHLWNHLSVVKNEQEQVAKLAQHIDACMEIPLPLTQKFDFLRIKEIIDSFAAVQADLQSLLQISSVQKDTDCKWLAESTSEVIEKFLGQWSGVSPASDTPKAREL